jgi:hypothetical protein
VINAVVSQHLGSTHALANKHRSRPGDAIQAAKNRRAIRRNSHSLGAQTETRAKSQFLREEKPRGKAPVSELKSIISATLAKSQQILTPNPIPAR